jgi:hypothetical protein
VTSIDSIPRLVRSLYEIVAELEKLFPGRKFTPDGHLVGSIGEVLAAHRYGLELLAASAERHDATSPDGRLVQIKATQTGLIGMRSEPDHLLVLKLNSDGSADEVYNGPGAAPWEQAGRLQKNGQRAISLARLRRLMDHVSDRDRVRVSESCRN